MYTPVLRGSARITGHKVHVQVRHAVAQDKGIDMRRPLNFLEGTTEAGEEKTQRLRFFFRQITQTGSMALWFYHQVAQVHCICSWRKVGVTRVQERVLVNGHAGYRRFAAVLAADITIKEIHIPVSRDRR
jgi:hypothetical protein